MVVLVKLSVLAKWLARNTPLRKPNRGEGIVSIKPRPKSACDFLGLSLLFIASLFYYVLVLFPLPTWYNYFLNSMARYSLFVLKVPLSPKQTNKKTFCRHRRLVWVSVGFVAEFTGCMSVAFITQPHGCCFNDRVCTHLESQTKPWYHGKSETRWGIFCQWKTINVINVVWGTVLTCFQDWIWLNTNKRQTKEWLLVRYVCQSYR